MKKKLNIILNILIILVSFHIVINIYASVTSYRQINIATPAQSIKENNVNYIQYYQNYYKNKDIIAVLQLYPSEFITIVPQTNNNTYYLNHLINHEKSKLGSTFLDYRILITTKRNLIIYGHNSYNDNTPFNKLTKLLDYKYYQNHQTIKLTTKHYINTYQIFSVYKTTNDYIHTNIYFKDETDYLNYLTKLKEKSIHSSNIKIANKPSLILQTCLNNETILVVSALKKGENYDQENTIS